MGLKFTVIVPTYNDLDRTKKCIQSLINQSINSENYEVIIIDNNIEPLDYGDLPLNFTLLHEQTPGSYSARNLGVRNAKGEYLAFTDSDCIVDKNWLENCSKIIGSVDERISGRISLFNEDENKNSTIATYEKIFSFDQREAALNGVSVTANLIVRREFFLKVGFFDTHLLSGGDHEWNSRANKLEKNIHYTDDILVYHPIRGSFEELLRKRRRTLGGNYHKFSFLGIVKMFFPPYDVIGKIKKHQDISFKEKIYVFLLRYILDFISGLLVLAYKMKIIEPTRS